LSQASPFSKGEEEAMKKVIAAVAVMVLITVWVVACGGSAGSGGSTDVHMGQTNFTQASLTISKGSSINLINDTAVTHLIANGTWQQNTAHPGAEPGAPTVNNLQFTTATQSHTIGPFTTAGTFHLYCIVHPGMNLTVTVQ
jgi:plastocyanin